MVTSDGSSDDSDLSDDAYLKEISANWGEQESELRQALFFQFTQRGALNRDSMLTEERLSQYDRLLDRESMVSQEDMLGNRASVGMSFQLHADHF